MSTEAEYPLPSSASESERLERQAGLYGGPEFLDPFLEAGPREVLEVGCGTGAFARHAAGRLPASRVVGLDLDAARVAFAQRRGLGLPNLAFERGDLYALPFEDGRFDLVYCRFVLVHAKDPTRAVAELARVTRPGGRVVAYDMVHDGIWFSPEKPAFAKILKAALEVLRDRGMEPNQGLHLGPAMVRAGLADVGVRVIPHHALASSPLFETYRRNWVETVAGLSEILGAHFDASLVEAARRELARTGPDDFLLELTVLAFGSKVG